MAVRVEDAQVGRDKPVVGRTVVGVGVAGRPTVRVLGKTSGVSVKELYQLFPKGPAKVAARVAGIPKPRGCI